MHLACMQFAVQVPDEGLPCAAMSSRGGSGRTAGSAGWQSYAPPMTGAVVGISAALPLGTAHSGRGTSVTGRRRCGEGLVQDMLQGVR